jgi:hypothetical protein
MLQSIISLMGRPRMIIVKISDSNMDKTWHSYSSTTNVPISATEISFLSGDPNI